MAIAHIVDESTGEPFPGIESVEVETLAPNMFVRYAVNGDANLLKLVYEVPTLESKFGVFPAILWKDNGTTVKVICSNCDTPTPAAETVPWTTGLECCMC